LSHVFVVYTYTSINNLALFRSLLCRAVIDDQSKVQRLLQIMDLKNLALEGFDAKLKKV